MPIRRSIRWNLRWLFDSFGSAIVFGNSEGELRRCSFWIGQAKRKAATLSTAEAAFLQCRSFRNSAAANAGAPVPPCSAGGTALAGGAGSPQYAEAEPVCLRNPAIASRRCSTYKNERFIWAGSRLAGSTSPINSIIVVDSGSPENEGALFVVSKQHPIQYIRTEQRENVTKPGTVASGRFRQMVTTRHRRPSSPRRAGSSAQSWIRILRLRSSTLTSGLPVSKTRSLATTSVLGTA